MAASPMPGPSRLIRRACLAHIPAKWTPVRRQEYAPTNESRAHSDSVGTECALVSRLRSFASIRGDLRAKFAIARGFAFGRELRAQAAASSVATSRAGHRS